MRTLLLFLTVFAISATRAQERKVVEQLEVANQTKLDLDFAFAQEINIEIWDKNKVEVEVSVLINDGEDNELFMLKKRSTSSTLYFEMDQKEWEKQAKGKKRKCSWQTDIKYKVRMPKHLTLAANTISGDYKLTYFGKTLDLKTISGEIDIEISEMNALDFKAKTISGEIFTDLDIDFLNGKEGLRQIVGQNVHGRIGKGGIVSEFESISGNIYMRAKQ